MKRITMLADGKVAIVEVSQWHSVTGKFSSCCHLTSLVGEPWPFLPGEGNMFKPCSCVQVPVEGFATDWMKMRYDRNNFK